MYKTDLLFRHPIFRHPRLLTFLNVLLSLVLFVFVLVFARELLTVASKKGEKRAPAAYPAFHKTGKGLLDYAGVLSNNPFGFPAGQLKPLSASKEGSLTHSDIVLVGTISGPSATGYAIFMDKNGRQEVFKAGEPVFNAGKLKRIYSDMVFISEGGREVKIPMTELLRVKDVSASGDGVSSSDFARSAGRGTFVVDQKKVLYALENPNQLMTDARLQPNISNGVQEGFVLREVRNGGIYQSLGLQNGDVLLRINDYNISNPDNALQAFTALRGMDRVQVDILRAGAKMTLTYQIR